MEHFYPYLDGCVNLVIEVDATTALGLFGHKDKCAADELANLRQQLCALGVHQCMLRYRPGETHATADYLSRDKEYQRPPKTTLATKEVAEPAATVAAFASADNDEDTTSDHGNPASDNEDEASEEARTLSRGALPARLARAAEGAIRVPIRAQEQLGDKMVKEWRELCERSESTLGSNKNDALYSEVDDMCMRGGVLHHLIPSWVPGAVGQWVPVSSQTRALAIIKQVHTALCHPGRDRTLAFVARRLWC